jgi:D-serine deaminase-like pyridoxal phosphate-dependent protein
VGDEYERWKRALGAERLPCALVDLEAFDANWERALAAVRGRGKTIRLATKSVRVPALLRRALERGGGLARGLMCYAVEEAVWLAEQGFEDLLVAYPSVQPADLEALGRAAAAGHAIAVVVDCAAHLEALSRAGRAAGATLRAVIELDVAWRPLPGLHVGARRSPLRRPEDVVRLAQAARALERVEVAGLLAYEAHVAGVPDAGSAAVRLMKRLAAPAAAELRARAVAALGEAGFTCSLVNGGGTGSLETTAREPAVTEIAVGSALFAPHLFDGFRGLGLRPAAFFACAVARASDPGLVTCQGGGYVASGAAGRDRLPRPWLPEGLALLGLEGAGEVQTPLDARGAAVALAPGDPVFFRHAKAGELAERFNEVLLVEGDRVVGRAPTYRGLGRAFG